MYMIVYVIVQKYKKEKTNQKCNYYETIQKTGQQNRKEHQFQHYLPIDLIRNFLRIIEN